MALTSFKSNLIADVGISMGDEGKGRLIPEIVRELQTLTGRRDVVGTVLKVNGGANSGHTVAGLKLNLLPGGVAEHDVACLALGAAAVPLPADTSPNLTIAQFQLAEALPELSTLFAALQDANLIGPLFKPSHHSFSNSVGACG